MPNRVRVETPTDCSDCSVLLTPETALELGNALLDAVVLCKGYTVVDILKMPSGRYIALQDSGLEGVGFKVQKERLTVIK